MIHKFRQSIISMAVKIYIARIGVDDLRFSISDVADYIKISKSGVTVDPEFWIGRFNRNEEKK